MSFLCHAKFFKTFERARNGNCSLNFISLTINLKTYILNPGIKLRTKYASKETSFSIFNFAHNFYSTRDIALRSATPPTLSGTAPRDFVSSFFHATYRYGCYASCKQALKMKTLRNFCLFSTT